MSGRQKLDMKPCSLDMFGDKFPSYMAQYQQFTKCIDFEELKDLTLSGNVGVTNEFTTLVVEAKRCLDHDHCRDQELISESDGNIALSVLTAYENYDPSKFEGNHIFRENKFESIDVEFPNKKVEQYTI